MADKTEKKPGFVARMKGFGANIAKFFRDTKSELKKVVWPSKADVKTNTIVVAIAAVVMIALDAIFGGILGLIIGA